MKGKNYISNNVKKPSANTALGKKPPAARRNKSGVHKNVLISKIPTISNSGDKSGKNIENAVNTSRSSISKTPRPIAPRILNSSIDQSKALLAVYDPASFSFFNEVENDTSSKQLTVNSVPGVYDKGGTDVIVHRENQCSYQSGLNLEDNHGTVGCDINNSHHSNSNSSAVPLFQLIPTGSETDNVSCTILAIEYDNGFTTLSQGIASNESWKDTSGISFAVVNDVVLEAASDSNINGVEAMVSSSFGIDNRPCGTLFNSNVIVQGSDVMNCSTVVPADVANASYELSIQSPSQEIDCHNEVQLDLQDNDIQLCNDSNTKIARQFSWLKNERANKRKRTEIHSQNLFNSSKKNK